MFCMYWRTHQPRAAARLAGLLHGLDTWYTLLPFHGECKISRKRYLAFEMIKGVGGNNVCSNLWGIVKTKGKILVVPRG